jgi:hypothetical protein
MMYSKSDPKRIESGNSAVSSLPESRIGSTIIAENLSQPDVLIGSFFGAAAAVAIPTFKNIIIPLLWRGRILDHWAIQMGSRRRPTGI